MDKHAQDELLGQVMAHAFHQELHNIKTAAAEASPTPDSSAPSTSASTHPELEPYLADQVGHTHQPSSTAMGMRAGGAAGGLAGGLMGAYRGSKALGPSTMGRAVGGMAGLGYGALGGGMAGGMLGGMGGSLVSRLRGEQAEPLTPEEQHAEAVQEFLADRKAGLQHPAQ